jgi:quercetin dioxygenase-like cupin family protein
MPFIRIADYPAIEPVPGCRMRTPFGQHLMLSYLEMDEGAEVPLHHHPHEQGGILLKGQVQLTIGDETRIVEAGSLFLIPPNVPHRAVAVNGPATGCLQPDPRGLRRSDECVHSTAGVAPLVATFSRTWAG